jgi:hypothetical protein
MSKSNGTKVHPGRDPGPRSVPKCGIVKFDPSNRYVHFFPNVVQRLFADVIHDAIWFMNIHEQNHP